MRSKRKINPICCLQYFWSFPRDLASLKHPPSRLLQQEQGPHCPRQESLGVPSEPFWESLSFCWQKVGKWSCPSCEQGYFKPRNITLAMFQQPCLNAELRVLPRALCECYHFSSACGRSAGWGQKPYARQKACSWIKKGSCAFCRRALHPPKMSLSFWQKLPWISFHEVVQKGLIEPFVLRVG